MCVDGSRALNKFWLTGCRGVCSKSRCSRISMLAARACPWSGPSLHDNSVQAGTRVRLRLGRSHQAKDSEQAISDQPCISAVHRISW